MGRIWPDRADYVQGVRRSRGPSSGPSFEGAVNPAEFLRQLSMEPSVRDLVDGLRVGVARVMPHAECEVAKCKALAISDEAENHAELAARSGR
jgi:hypothetical protein